MSDRVSNSSTHSPLASYQPETTHAPPKPGPTSSVERNTIERAEQAAIGGTRFNTVGRDSMTDMARRLDYDQSVQFGCKAVVSASVAAQTEGKITIERRHDGRYEVSASASAQLGSGSTHGRTTAGVGAGTKFVVESPEAAADIAHAMATLGVSATVNSNIGLNFVSIPLDSATGTTKFALERLHHYRENLVDARVDIRGTGVVAEGRHGNAVNAHVAAEVGVAGEVRIDFEKGELIEAAKLSLGAEARANLKLGEGTVAKSLSLSTAGVDGETKTDVRLERRRHVDPKLLEKVKHGELEPAALLASLKHAKAEWVLSAEHETELSLTGGIQGTGKVKLEGELPVSAEIGKALLAGDSKTLEGALGHLHWKGSAEIGLGKEVGVDHDLALFQAGAMSFKKLGETEGSLDHCLGRMGKLFADEHNVNAQLGVDRAVLNLRD